MYLSKTFRVISSFLFSSLLSSSSPSFFFIVKMALFIESSLSSARFHSTRLDFLPDLPFFPAILKYLNTLMHFHLRLFLPPVIRRWWRHLKKSRSQLHLVLVYGLSRINLIFCDYRDPESLGFVVF